jgi:hypothetical protein
MTVSVPSFPISQLPLAGPLFGDEQTVVVQFGISRRAPVSSIAALGPPPGLVYLNLIGFAEIVAVTAANTLAPLSNVPVDGATTMELVVNGRVFAGCESPPSFTVSGNTITWTSTIYSVNPGDVVIAHYHYAAQSFGPGASPPSTALPLMDGIAAAGVAIPYSREDHVHPHDTSLTGMNDNRIINGNFSVNNRAYVSGTALSVAVYGHDRWKAGAGGCTYTFTAAIPDTAITITAGTLTQIIEAGWIEGGVYTLSWTGTAQGRVYQGSPTGSYAASPIVTASLTAGTNVIVEFNTGTLTRAKLEIGSVATSFNRSSLTKVLADCQRYYQTYPNLMINGYTLAGSAVLGEIVLPVVMRGSPTVAYSNLTLVNTSAISSAYVDAQSVRPTVTATATAVTSATFSMTLAAEL